MGKLVRFLADGTAQEINLDRERLTIGRRPDNDICIRDLAVSGEHAVIVTILADSFLEDLGSTNGTLVNGNSVSKHFLRDRDEIDVGRQIIFYLASDSASLDGLPRTVHRADHGEGAADEATATSGEIGRAAAGASDGRDADAAIPPAMSEAQRFASAANTGAKGGARAAEAAGSAMPPSPAPPAPGKAPPSLKVLDGPRAGHVVSLSKSETVVGRAGVQVATLRRVDNDILIVPLEGASPPSVNGAPVPPSGMRLSSGDLVEIAGARLEFSLAASPGL